MISNSSESEANGFRLSVVYSGTKINEYPTIGGQPSWNILNSCLEQQQNKQNL
jgi:hypothetical protein